MLFSDESETLTLQEMSHALWWLMNYLERFSCMNSIETLQAAHQLNVVRQIGIINSLFTIARQNNRFEKKKIKVTIDFYSFRKIHNENDRTGTNGHFTRNAVGLLWNWKMKNLRSTKLNCRVRKTCSMSSPSSVSTVDSFLRVASNQTALIFNFNL